jgi:hypothetical protein
MIEYKKTCYREFFQASPVELVKHKKTYHSLDLIHKKSI